MSQPDNQATHATPDMAARIVRLHVLNPEVLAYGSTPSHTVTDSGCVIGSGVSADWLLTDADGAVASRHCEIFRLQGAFCLVDRCGRTCVNGHTQPLGVDRAVRLTHSDLFTVGSYKVLVSGAGEAIDWTSALSEQGDPLAVLHHEGLELVRADGGIVGKAPYAEAHRALAEERAALERLSGTCADDAFDDPLMLLVSDAPVDGRLHDVLELIDLPGSEPRASHRAGSV
jgi:predicted component of type VI protein secretion system